METLHFREVSSLIRCFIHAFERFGSDLDLDPDFGEVEPETQQYLLD